ncbi:MAG: hypothetical protein ACYCPT_03950, partial [Acidimicrobiales bacterium]
ENGKKIYEKAMYDNKPLTEATFHHFVKRDYMIREGRIIIDAILQGDSYITLQCYAHRLVIEPLVLDSFSDELTDEIATISTTSIEDKKNDEEVEETEEEEDVEEDEIEEVEED